MNKIIDTLLNRYPIIDQLRGLAIVLMIYFHFSYDLAHFGFTDSNFYKDIYWQNLRTLIVSLFVFIVGVSLVLATRKGIQFRRYAKRVGILLLFSILITVNSYFMFPGRTIIIGILHFIALASLLGLLFLRFYYLNLLFGTTLIWIGNSLQFAVFDNIWLHWLGLMTHKPVTEDYVPLIPWFGVVLLGMFFGQTVLKYPKLNKLITTSFNNPVAHGMSFLGRHSLLVYILHQPILYGGTWLVYMMLQHQ